MVELREPKGCGQPLNEAYPEEVGRPIIIPILCGMIVPLPDPYIPDETSWDSLLCKTCGEKEIEYLTKAVMQKYGKGANDGS